MENIIITKDENVLAHHTTDSSRSSYGQPVWVVEDENPDPGSAVWSQGDNRQQIQIIGVVGGWLVAAQADGLLCGVIWSDGNYYANLIENRETGRPLRATKNSMNEVANGKYRVKGTVVLFDDSPLGSILT